MHFTGLKKERSNAAMHGALEYFLVLLYLPFLPYFLEKEVGRGESFFFVCPMDGHEHIRRTRHDAFLRL